MISICKNHNHPENLRFINGLMSYQFEQCFDLDGNIVGQ